MTPVEVLRRLILNDTRNLAYAEKQQDENRACRVCADCAVRHEDAKEIDVSSDDYCDARENLERAVALVRRWHR